MNAQRAKTRATEPAQKGITGAKAMKRKQLPRDVNKCEGCKRAVRQEGEGAMCFNCYLAKKPLPTAQEIEADDYSTDQVARMHDRLTELEARELAFIQSLRELELQLAKLREALHEIYGKACQAMSADDDLYLYSFAKDARDIALEAAIRTSPIGHN